MLCARKKKQKRTHMHGHARTARPPGRPDERPEERAIYKQQVQSLAPAISLAEPPPAASPQPGRWICQQGLRSARMHCLLLVLAAARLLLLLCCCCCCCFDDDCSSCLFTFGHISYWYDNSRASYFYCCIYLLSVQSPAPANSLAEPPPAASLQLGRWGCQQGLRSARIRGLLLLLAAASACCCQCCCCCFDDDCPFLSFHVWSHIILV